MSSVNLVVSHEDGRDIDVTLKNRMHSSCNVDKSLMFPKEVNKVVPSMRQFKYSGGCSETTMFWTSYGIQLGGSRPFCNFLNVCSIKLGLTSGATGGEDNRAGHPNCLRIRVELPLVVNISRSGYPVDRTIKYMFYYR